MIKDIIITPLKQIIDERGKVMHMLRSDSPHFQNFGEIYFSTISPGAVKAWHKHKKMTLNYAVPYGNIKFVLFDDRPDSSSNGEIIEIYLGPDNYFLVTVPPGIWNGFKGIYNKSSLVANCSTIPHNSSDIIRKDPFDSFFPYDWEIKHN